MVHSIVEYIIYVFHIFDGGGRLALNNFLIVLCNLSSPTHFLDRGWLGEVDTDVLLVTDEVLDDALEVLDLLEEQGHVELVVGLLPRLVDFAALLPVQLHAGQRLDPVVGAVAHVLQEVEVVFPNLAAVVAVVEGALAHHQLVAVLVEVRQEEAQYGHHDDEQSPDIGQHLVNLADCPVESNDLG